MRSLAVRGQGRFIEAKQLCESTIREAHELGQEQWLAHPFYVLALLARDQGNFQGAVQWIRESLVRLTDTGEVAMLAQCHHFLGEVAFLRGDLTEARTELEISLQRALWCSLESLFHFPRLYGALPQHCLLVCSSSREGLQGQLEQENQGLASQAVTAAHFLHERRIQLPAEVRQPAERKEHHQGGSPWLCSASKTARMALTADLLPLAERADHCLLP